MKVWTRLNAEYHTRCWGWVWLLALEFAHPCPVSKILSRPIFAWCVLNADRLLLLHSLLGRCNGKRI